MITNGRKKSDFIVFCIALLLFLYTAIRAMLLSITWDEAYTYIEFARNGKVFLDKYDMMSANNHMLNTALMMLFTKLFGLSEFVMRIPVLAAHFLFLFYSAKLLRNINNKWLVIAAFVVVNVNPYMLDFFSVARGYGLSLGLMMASIYYLYVFQAKENKGKWALISMLFAGLAVFANFVLLNYFVVLYGLLWLISVYGATEKSIAAKIKMALKKMILPTLILAVLFVIIIPIALELKKAGALFFGGEKSFWSDTICTITDRSFYEIGYNYWFQRVAKGFVFLVLIFSAVYVLLRISKKQLNGNTLFIVTLLLLLGLCSLSTIMQHHLLQTPYLLDRTALFLVVLFNLIFVFFTAEISASKSFAGLAVHASAVVLLIHFSMCFNMRYVLEWRYDADTKDMLTDLEQVKIIPKGKETVSIGIPLIFDPAINFYREKNQLTWLNTVWRKETNNMCHDYFCLSQKDLAAFNRDSLEIIKTYPGTENVLAKSKYLPKEIKASYEKQISFESGGDGYYTVDESVEYAPGFSYIENDSLTPNKKGVVAFYAEVKAPDFCNDNLVMVLSFQDAKGELYSWQKAYVKDFIRNEEDWFHATFTAIIPPGVKAGDEIKAYIWNPDKHALYIKKMEFKWLSYSY